MKEVVAKFAELEREVAVEKGPFNLFAIVMREDAPVWDLLVAAPWVPANRRPALEYLVSKIKQDLGPDQLLSLSRIVLFDPEHPAVKAFNNIVHIEHGNVEFSDANFFGLHVKDAYVITSQRSVSPARKRSSKSSSKRSPSKAKKKPAK